MQSVQHRLASLAGLALETLQNLLADADTPPSVRLRAAKLVLDQAGDVPPSDPGPRTSSRPEEMPLPSSTPFPVPSPKPAPIVLSPVERTGRNEACPCGSGLKFKKCCLNGSPLRRFAALSMIRTPA